MLKAAPVFLTIWLGVPLLSCRIAGTTEKAGQVGDAFGIVSSLLTAITVVYVINSFRMQAKQMEMYHYEIAANIRINTIVALLEYTPVQIADEKEALFRLDPSLKQKSLNPASLRSEIDRLNSHKPPDQKAAERQVRTIGSLETLERLLVQNDKLYEELIALSSKQGD
jgi:hypothetical protein